MGQGVSHKHSLSYILASSFKGGPRLQLPVCWVLGTLIICQFCLSSPFYTDAELSLRKFPL